MMAAGWPHPEDRRGDLVWLQAAAIWRLVTGENE